MRLTTAQQGEHHLTIPRHDPLKPGTLAAILGEVARHFDIGRDELLTRLFPAVDSLAGAGHVRPFVLA